MRDPSVSVIIGVYNRASTIAQAVESVLAQTYVDYEVIVVDDASTDATLDILGAYRERIRLVRNLRNSGLPAVPRNQAMAIARGRYFAFLDSDDYWYPAKLERQIACMESMPSCALSHTFCHVVNADGQVLYTRREKEMPQQGDLFSTLLRDCFITTSTVVIPRSAYEAIGGFAEHPQLRRGEDHELFLRYARSGDIAFVPDVLAAHRKFPGNISGDGRTFQSSMLQSQKWILDHSLLWEGRAKRAEVLAAYLDKCLAFSWDQQSRGDWRQAFLFNLQACLHGPLVWPMWTELFKTFVKAAGFRLKRAR